MSYIGSTPTTQSFIAGTDYFNGDGTTVNFTLSRSVNSVNDIEVIVNNVEQIPSGYSVSGTTLTFSAAPSAGTSNVYVRYLSTTNLSLAIPSGTSATFNTITATTVNTTALTTTNGASIQGLTVGKGAGAVATNTAFGTSALAANQAGGTNNTAIGNAALDANTTGDANTAVGDDALGANTTASNNTAVGYQAHYFQTTGGANTVLGTQAGYGDATGSSNTWIGYAAGPNTVTNASGTQNVAVGRNALYSNTTASNNTAVGYQALDANTTGADNVAVGKDALGANTTASFNTAVGFQAGNAQTIAEYNTFIGYKAGLSTTGDQNTFLGKFAGNGITTGTLNTILGSYNGNQGGLDIRTSSSHIVLSDGGGNPRAYWDANGTQVTQSANSAGAQNSFQVKNGAASALFTVRDDGRIGTGGAASPYNNTTGSAANMFVDASGVFYRSTSSLKYKRDVQDATHGLAEVLQLRPVTYKGKGENDGETVFGGLIAEEVHEVGLTEFVQYAEDESPDALAYGNMVSLMVKAMQEQQALITALTNRITALEQA